MARKHDINQWIFQIPLQDVQDEGLGDVTLGDNCVCCGKKMLHPAYAVHLLTNGNLVSTEEPFEGREDQGFFSIGRECIKRLPNNFYFKL